MPFDYLLADRQAHACAIILIPLMEPLKHSEDLFKELRVDSHSVVFYGELPHGSAILFGGYVYVRHPMPLVLDGVAHKVLKQLDELNFVRGNHRQGSLGYNCAALFDGAAEIEEGLLEGPGA